MPVEQSLELAIWSGINVVLPLLGLPIIYLVTRMFNPAIRKLEIINDGQLYMFSAAIASVALYDIGKRHAGMSANELLGALVASVMCLAVAMILYGVSIVAKYAVNPNQRAMDLLATTSIVWLGLTLAIVLGFRAGLGVI